MSYPIFRWTLFPVLRSFFGTIDGLNHLPKPPYIIAANHVGSIDYVFIAAVISQTMSGKVHFIAQSEWWRDYPVKHCWECIIIDPHNKDACLDEAEQYLKGGQVCAIFPEGRASRNEPELLPGKFGVARLALRTGMPVVPVGFIGPCGRGTFFKSLWGFRNFYKKTELHIGQPMRWPAQDSRIITQTQLEDTTSVIMTEIGRLCRRIYPY